MTYILVKCSKCKSEIIRKFGFDKKGNQRYECKNQKCERKTFILDYTNNACLEGINDKIIDMAMNGSGIRDTARVLKISSYKVMNELKKRK